MQWILVRQTALARVLHELIAHTAQQDARIANLCQAPRSARLARGGTCAAF